jgi:hypothetical protein
MISSSLLSRVPPKNCMSSSPPERLRTSSACQSKPTAADSGWRDDVRHHQLDRRRAAMVGARPEAMMPARPPLIAVRRRSEAGCGC